MIDPTHWRVDAFFSVEPDSGALRTFLGEVCALREVPFELTEVAPRDWVSVSQSARPPITAGRFIVHGSHDRKRVGRRRWAIEIDAGQAFGTGHHGTTAGCLIAIDRATRSRSMRRGLDLGTGSGVLAIAMAMAGSRKVVASDNDPIAVTAARRAIQENGMGAKIEAVVATGLDHQAIRRSAPYDLVTANILAKPLAGLAGCLSRHVRPGGTLILSGLLHDQAPAIEARYRACGFVVGSRIALEEWRTLIMQRH